MPLTSVLRVAVAGLGRAGSGYDAGSNGVPRSHVGAIHATPGLAVTALVDPCRAAIDRTLRQWPEIETAARYARLFDLPARSADIIVLATPPETRLADLEAATTRAPKVILAEKPLAPSCDEALRGARIAEDCGAILRINFHRRFDPGYRALRRSLTGAPAKLVMRYNNGLLNYAPHHVDLLMDWFGAVERVQAFGDPGAHNLSFCCRMATGCDAVFIGVDDDGYDQFDVEIVYPDKRIEIANGGCEKTHQEPVGDLYYPGYRHLGPRNRLAPFDTVGGLVEYYRAIRDHLVDGEPLEGCDGFDAARGLAVIEAAVTSARHNGRAIAPRSI